MRDPLFAAAHPLWLASLVPDAARFVRALMRPEATQRALLLRRLRDNADSAYGRMYGFGTITSVADYQRRVPIVRHDALIPHFERIAAGEEGVLTRAPVRLFERSGGTSATATKLIPYTGELLGDFARATHPWLVDMHARLPGLIGRPAYWSLSPVVQGDKATAGGVPIGIDDDSAYFGALGRRVVARSLAVPARVAKAPDFATWRHATLVHLVAAAELGFISIWSPTFLTTLMDALAEDPDPIRRAVPAARAKALDKALRARSGKALWPHLQAISCWADGPAAAFVPALARWFEGVPVLPKGLLATEGVVTIPWRGTQVIALASHFFEFIAMKTPDARPALAHELAPGELYTPLLTTGGGLYRYHLEDLVQCIGPLQVRFVGKLEAVSDLAGEKLHPVQVQRALEALAPSRGVDLDGLLLAPVQRPRAAPYYRLYVDAAISPDALAALGRDLDEALSAGHAYRYARDLGQLGPVVAQRVFDLRRRHLAALVARGQRLGDIKPALLDARPFWSDVFEEGEPA